MFTKALKQSMSLAVVMAALAGCSSTSTTDSTATPAATPDTSASTSAVDSSAVSGSAADESMAMLDTVFYFDFDKSVLKPEARAALTGHATKLKAAPRAVRLEGHADERGTREYNMALGERRAKAVRDFLVLQGVDAANLETISYGEERLADPSDHSMNRRVELK